MLTVEEAARAHQKAQERLVSELWKTGRVRPATRQAAIDAMLMVLAAGLAKAAAEPEGPPEAGELDTVTP